MRRADEQLSLDRSEGCHVSASKERPLGAGPGRRAAGLAEICIESSADDQPPHLTGPSSDLIQFGISKKAAHGEVVDVAISTCEAEVGRERTELKAGVK